MGFEPLDNASIIEEFTKSGFKDKLKLRQMLVDLAKDGKLIKLSNEYYIHTDYYKKALNFTKDFIDKNEKMAMTDLRDMLATSRKYAILIIDSFDQKRITELHGLYRVKGANYGKI